MKKAILTIGLFTLVLASTSFAAPTTSTTNDGINPIDGNGGQDAGGHRKVDFAGNRTNITSAIHINDNDVNGGQDTGGNKKLD